MVLKLYYDLLSQPARAIYILLQDSKIPFEKCPISLMNRDQLSENYAKINRFQKVPTLVDGNFHLSESVAIVRYVNRKYGLPEKWYPSDLERQARVDEFLEWQHINLRLHAISYLWLKVLLPRISNKQPDSKTLASKEKAMKNSLDQFKKYFLVATPFVTGNQLTVADLFAACEIEQLVMAGYDATVGRPELKSWLDRVRKELHPLYEETHATVYALAPSKL